MSVNSLREKAPLLLGVLFCSSLGKHTIWLCVLWQLL